MSKTMRLKIVIDILMTAALLLLMPYGLLGEAYHEWIGTGMLLLFVAHHVLNRKWMGSLRKGKYTPFRILQTVIVLAVLLTMLGSMISGILLSRHAFPFVDVHGVAMPARNVHMVCAYWNLVLMSLHLGLHWSILIGVAGKRFQNPSAVRMGSARIAGVAIAAYEELFPVLEELGIGYVAFSPLANGLLSGRYDNHSQFDRTYDYRSVMPQFQAETMEKNQNLLTLIRKIAVENHATPAQISMAWMLCKKPYIVPIPGTRKTDRMEENAKAADLLLTKEQVRELDQALDAVEMSDVFGGTKMKTEKK